MGIPLVKLPGAGKKRKRVGRGISAGQGKTCGRGMKGQGARSAKKSHPRFEGGRLPVARQLPKFGGFKRNRKVSFHPINLKDLSNLPESVHVVDLSVLKEFSIFPKKSLPIKVLGDGEINRPLKIFAHAFSKSAKEKIESAGGSCEVIEL